MNGKVFHVGASDLSKGEPLSLTTNAVVARIEHVSRRRKSYIYHICDVTVTRPSAFSRSLRVSQTDIDIEI